MNIRMSFALVCALSAGCSSTGGIYDKNDPKNDQFSLGATVLGAVSAVVIVAAAAAVGRGGGGGGGYAQTDYDWAWDQFYNQYSQLVWVCRGKQTGEFAVQDKCASKPVNDSTWPAK